MATRQQQQQQRDSKKQELQQPGPASMQVAAVPSVETPSARSEETHDTKV